MAYPVPGFAAWNAAWSPAAAKAWTAPGGKMAGWAAKGVPAVPAAGVPGIAPAGGCMTMYGPVANVCNTATTVQQTVPTTVTQLVPVSTVTPIPSNVAPQTAYGTPIPIAASKGVAPGVAGAGVPGAGVGAAGAVPGIGAYGKGAPGIGAYGKGAPGVGAYGKGAPGVGAYGKGAPGVGAYGVGAPGVGAYGAAGPLTDIGF